VQVVLVALFFTCPDISVE